MYASYLDLDFDLNNKECVGGRAEGAIGKVVEKREERKTDK